MNNFARFETRHRSVGGNAAWYSGLRQVLFGLAAAAVTFLIGILIGIAVS
jgi:VIT1/CCC1 family predicted Fe2+/Mn2+ transporter